MSPFSTFQFLHDKMRFIFILFLFVAGDNYCPRTPAAQLSTDIHTVRGGEETESCWKYTNGKKFPKTKL